ncbi:hypothetical protein BGW36DRAFT_129026 [Talaromyces proteolyticus]|uniref:Uncharacterized protein n=1 Tax=Talaromyces proteolyticus TaxID=1131652 RepID=A0AAD4KUX0_9EURO|nr:uncharacterized protein BGW36DRAFT_129026 [Talaromyces proteolyticus]KAH8700435.1 hypothetical protein BGW36DRAFT_129026 [Talaromyces proteolyticus]
MCLPDVGFMYTRYRIVYRYFFLFFFSSHFGRLDHLMYVMVNVLLVQGALISPEQAHKAWAFTTTLFKCYFVLSFLLLSRVACY